MPATAPARLWWIDHARTFVIVLVVNLHACVTYSHVGDWYVKSGPEPTLTQKLPYIVWIALLQSFFMGLLFFFAGFFAHRSLDRRSSAGFLRERLLRLGLPALLYMLAIHPFILLVLNPWGAKFGPAGTWYLKYLKTGRFLGSTGPLWFAVALLLFSLLLAALWWVTRRERPALSRSAPSAPRAWQLWLFALLLGVGTFGVRLVYPLGSSVLNLQLCYFVQYLAFFFVGVHAARHQWLESFAASRDARAAGWIALIAGPILLLAILGLGSRTGGITMFFGGLHWQAFALALWEQLAGVGLSCGVLALFSRRLAQNRPWASWLAERSFAVYVLHAPVLIALTIAFRELPFDRPALILLLTVSCLVGTFLLADLARRVPGIRAIL